MGDTYGDRILSSNTGLDLSIAAKVLADFQMLDNLPVHTGCLDIGVMEKLVGARFDQYRRQDNIYFKCSENLRCAKSAKHRYDQGH